MTDLSKVKDLDVVYVGKDQGYIDSIKFRMQERFPNITVNVHQFSLSSEVSYSNVFVDIVKLKPSIIYIDFTYELKLSQKLSRFCRRENELQDSVITALIDKKAAVRVCRSCGSHFTHVKCAEFHDVIFDPMAYLFPDGAKPDQFATAKLEREVQLVNLFRVGFIAEEYIHVEGDLRLNVGDQVKVSSEIPKDIVPSQSYIVEKIYEHDLYYDYKYAYDLKYVYVDPPHIDIDAEVEIMVAGAEDDEAAKAKIRKKLESKLLNEQNEYQSLLEHSKKRVKNWVAEKYLDSKPKTTKVFILDKEFSLLKKSSKDIESYPCSFRIQSHIHEDMRSLKRNRPNIIVYQFVTTSYEKLLEDPSFNEERAKEYMEKLKDESKIQLDLIMDYIKLEDNYDPMVLIFNCPFYTTQNARSTYGYESIMMIQEDVAFETVVQMANLYEAKQEKDFEFTANEKIKKLRAENSIKYGRMKPSDFKEKRIYLSRTDPKSFVSTDFSVTLLKVNESVVEIATEEELQLINYDLDYPVNMSVRLLPVDGKDYREDGGKKVYKGLIHSTSEIEKKELRRLVNEVYCEPAAKEREQEEVAFKELNEQVAMKMEVERLKKEEEAAVKAAEDKAEAKELAAKEGEQSPESDGSDPKDQAS